MIRCACISSSDDCARIHFENGCVANLTASRVTPNRKRKIRIFQPDTYLSIDYIEQEVEIFQRVPITSPEPGMPNISIVRKKEKIEKKELEADVEEIERDAASVDREA